MKDKRAAFLLRIPLLVVSVVLWLFIQRNAKKRDAEA